MVLKPGVSESAANACLRALASNLAREHADVRPDYIGMSLKVWNIREAVVGGIRTAMIVLLCAVAVLLMIASANVANLLALARAAARQREMAVLGRRLAPAASAWSGRCSSRACSCRSPEAQQASPSPLSCGASLVSSA